MKAKSTTKVTTRSKRKPAKKSQAKASALANCPINGAGWCPYPFSAAQLQKRLNQLKEQSEAQRELVTSSRTKGK